MVRTSSMILTSDIFHSLAGERDIKLMELLASPAWAMDVLKLLNIQIDLN